MLNNYACGALLVLTTLTSQAATRELPMMPWPEHVDVHEGKLVIDGTFRMGVCGVRHASLQRASRRFAEQLAAETGIFMPANPTGDCSNATLLIECQRAIDVPGLGDDESYSLEVTPQSAHLHAATSTGVLRGLATFLQLVRPDASSFAVSAISIQDRPRFPWRGFMLDVSRHWMPIEVVKRNLDAMAAVKLNVFHWHLSDDQGFRVESRIYPKLQGEGSDGHFYTQEQVRELVTYAAERGIRVVPEFDIPGHATSWLVGYPELGSAPGPYRIERNWGVLEATLDPSREATYRFLDRFIGEMAGLFPDAYFHIGGDEVDDQQWKANTAIQSFMRAHGLSSSAQLHAYFNQRIGAIVSKHGKKMIGWDEILAPELPKTAIIQSWRGQDSLAAAARQGYRGLLSFGYYLDHMRPASYHYANDPLSGDASNLTAEQAARILGGEACMWTEYVSPETVDSRIWPRLAAIAERLWSPAAVNDADSMYVRLEIVNRKLEWTGVKHRSGPPRVLDRISGYQFEPALAVLADSVEAAGIHERYPAHKYSSLEPLNRLVDAATAESESVRHLIADAKAITGAPDAGASERLGDAFQEWSRLPEAMAALAERSYLAGETAPVAETLARLGKSGMEALAFIRGHETPSSEWLAEQQALIEQASKLHAEVHISTVEVVKTLVNSLRVEPSGTGNISNSAK